jgi:short-subunit dehydrogenase
MNEMLKGKTVFITGASGGLGERITYQAALQGAEVYAAARRKEPLDKLSEKIKQDTQGKCYPIVLDVSDFEEVSNVFAAINDIDILVNNAGFGIFKTVADSTFDEMKGMFEVNVFGLITCTKMVLPKMLGKGHGHIINIASQGGKIATPKSSLYSATKHAVLAFSNSLRMELMNTGVYVTSVNPGPIRTNFFSIADESGNYAKSVDKWMLDADEVANKVVAAMLTKKREINLPIWMNAGSKLYQLFPGLVERAARGAFSKK